MQNRMDIRVRIKSPRELDFVRTGLMQYIENDSLYQQRNRVRLRQNRDLLARFDYDIRQLDSLQKFKYFEETRNMLPKNGGQMIFLQEQKTQLLYTDIYTLYSKKQFLETERDLYRGIVTVLSDFSIPVRRDNGVSYYAKAIVPLFLAFTLLLLIILANWGKIREVFKKY
jgi:hypothetical protein